jgi:hypothetical protein
MTLCSEGNFMIEINDKLSLNYTIIKSQFKYCNVDFLLLNNNNLYTCYIEYKQRQYANGYNNYPSFFIGKTKMDNIKKHYKNCIFIWDFRKSNSNHFFWIKYDDNFYNKYEVEKDYINNSYRFRILKDDCNNSYDEFIEYFTSIPNSKLI